MSTGLELWGSSVAKNATQNFVVWGGVRFLQAHALAKLPAMGKQPSAGIGPVTVYPTHSGVGPHETVYCRKTRSLTFC